jgi:inner membrane protein
LASIGHIAVGMVSGRLFLPREASRSRVVKSMVAFSALSMLPDADVIGFRLGIAYEHPWGHRGATHSLVFAGLIGLLALLAARPLKLPPLRTALFAGCTVATHGLLDSLTNGGLGAELLWPFSTERYFAPFTPIPVAPIGAGMASLRGVYVVVVETLYFAPLLIFAVFPPRRLR